MSGQQEHDENRFNTWADGMTPSGQQPPSSSSSAAEPAGSSSAPEPHEPTGYGSAAEPEPNDSGPGFPTYPYAAGSAFDDPSQDEAYTAFQGYQASTQHQPGQGYPGPSYSAQDYPGQDYPGQDWPGQAGYPGQAMQPYQAYQGPYGAPHSPFGRPQPNAPFAVPSLVLGIISMMSCGMTGPIGLGLGIAALRQIEASPNAFGGKGLAIAGIITGGLGTLFLLMMILGIFAG